MVIRFAGQPIRKSQLSNQFTNSWFRAGTKKPGPRIVDEFEGIQDSGFVLLDDDKTTATFAPISVLDHLQSYTVTLTSGIKDLAGNRLNSEKWSFTTEGQSSGSGGGGSTTGASDLGIKTAPGGEVGVLKEAAQYEEDSKLLDRLLPILYKKIDMNQLVAKADGKKLLEKVLPYLDVKLVIREQKGAIKKVDVEGLVHDNPYVYTECNQNEVVVGGGYSLTETTSSAEDYDNIPIQGRTVGNGWIVYAGFNDDGTLQGFAQCATLELGVKGGPEGSLIKGGSVDTTSDLGIQTNKETGILKELIP